ncbi:MAG: nucleotidyltransferase domain-containing protein [Spirochaetota bacterium]|nr:nucleotidyltransferase domain-containing protein [Spirochaetota bacterium]
MNLNKIKKIVIPPCKEFDVKRLDIFGSIAKGEASRGSDIDLIVEFNNFNYKPSKRYFGLLHYFEKAFNCKIDLITPDRIKNPYFLKKIAKDRINLYVG